MSYFQVNIWVGLSPFTHTQWSQLCRGESHDYTESVAGILVVSRWKEPYIERGCWCCSRAHAPRVQYLSYRLLAARADHVDHSRQLVPAAEFGAPSIHVVHGPPGARDV